MVYYIYELRWASSDNTLKELDASGSFFIVICAWLYCIVISIQYQTVDKAPSCEGAFLVS